MPGMTLREDRILRYVTAFCPECHNEAPDRPLEEVERLGGYLSEEGGRVWLVRGCPTHGRIRTLYDEDAEILGYLEEWTAPTKRHTPDTPGNYDPVPRAYLGGLGEMQTQHTCVLLEDVVAACNLRCPTCFSDSSPDLAGVVPPERVLANVDARLEREDGRLDVVMVSGGEPHPLSGAARRADTDAVVFTFDRAGTLITSVRSALADTELRGGAESPFSVVIPGGAQVNRYRISFRTGSQVLPHVDRRR